MNAGSAYPIQILRGCLPFDNKAMCSHVLAIGRKHLIVAIGTECYVTLPKGQIIPTQSATDHVQIPGGGHVLIVPITHYPTYSTIPSDLAPPIVEETNQCVFIRIPLGHALTRILDTRLPCAHSLPSMALEWSLSRWRGCRPKEVMRMCKSCQSHLLCRIRSKRLS